MTRVATYAVIVSAGLFLWGADGGSAMTATTVLALCIVALLLALIAFLERRYRG